MMHGFSDDIGKAQAIMARLLCGPIAWAVHKVTAERPSASSEASYWIEREHRSAIAWVRLALPTEWNAFDLTDTEDTARVTWVFRILCRVLCAVTIKEARQLLKSVAAGYEPISEADNEAPTYRPPCDSPGFDRWLVARWAASGLSGYLMRLSQSAWRQIQDRAQAAESLELTEIYLERARKDQAKLEKEVAKVGELMDKLAAIRAKFNGQALTVGTSGRVNGDVWIATDILDSGCRVRARAEGKAESKEFTAPTWMAAVELFLAETKNGKDGGKP